MKHYQSSLPLAGLAIVLFLLNSCSKPTPALHQSVTLNPATPDEMVMTPEGPIPRSHTHLVEAGYHLSEQNGHLFKVQTQTGKLMEDFGEARLHPLTTPQITRFG